MSIYLYTIELHTVICPSLHLSACIMCYCVSVAEKKPVRSSAQKIVSQPIDLEEDLIDEEEEEYEAPPKPAAGILLAFSLASHPFVPSAVTAVHRLQLSQLELLNQCRLSSTSPRRRRCQCSERGVSCQSTKEATR